MTSWMGNHSVNHSKKRLFGVVGTMAMHVTSALAVVSLGMSCGSLWSVGEPWSFSLTRGILERHPDQLVQDADPWSEDPNALGSSGYHGGLEEAWILPILCLPTVIDFLLLPITGIHDCFVE